MSGIQEILLLVALIVGLFLLPRLLPARTESQRTARKRPPVSGRMRLALVTSILWPALAAAYLRPWHGGLPAFLYIGVGPVAAGWALWWVLTGFRDARRRR